MHGRTTGCVTQFAKETGKKHCFGDRSKYAHGISIKLGNAIARLLLTLC